MNKSAPEAKKAPAKKAPAKKSEAKASPAKKASAKKTAKPRTAKPAVERKPRVSAAQRLLAKQQAREKKEQERANVRALKLRLDEEKRQAKVREREVKQQQREAAKLAERQARKEEKAAKKAALGGGRRPGLPTIKKDMQIADAELLRPWTERPITGRDLDILAKRFDLSSSEFAAALGLQNRFAFTVLLRSSKVVPFDVELLARLYEMSPSPAPWRSYGADEVFKLLYGAAIDKFGATAADRAFAETHYSVRFTAALDRSSSTAYRWMDESKQGARMVIALLLRKLMSMPNPRATLERVSTLVHSVRGGDFERRAPIPVYGMQFNRRGRAPGASRSPAVGEQLPLPSIGPMTL